MVFVHKGNSANDLHSNSYCLTQNRIHGPTKKTIKKDVTIYLDYILCAAKTAILKQNMFMQVPFSLDQQPLATESQSVLPILSYR